MTVVVGTAGHIDHGKTTLLRALTGIDADRLPEERRRGMTIDVGYAHVRLAGGAILDFVDVPGHDGLVGNMLVGAGEIDAALLVVAADDGARAQTVEHLELLDALRIGDGIAAVTKADLVGDERIETVVREVRELLARTGLDGIPVLPVSATTGAGFAELAAALGDLERRVADRLAAGSGGRTPRLAIDRVFTIRGRGTVVTGSLRGGSVSPGDLLRLEPGGASARVREVQVHGAALATPAPPGRTALNLAGVEAGSLRRGQVLTAGPGVEVSDRLLVELRRPAGLNGPADRRWPPADGGGARLHLGTSQAAARVSRRGRESVELPGGIWTALLRLDAPIAVAVGDRFVLRDPSPGRVVAGGAVLDPLPPRGPARRRITPPRLEALAAAVGEGHAPSVVAALVDLHGVLPSRRVSTIRKVLEALEGDRAGESPAAERDGDEPADGGSEAGDLMATDLAADLESAALAAVAAHHQAAPLSPGLPVAELRPGLTTLIRRNSGLSEREATVLAGTALGRLVTAGRLVRDGDRTRDPSRRPGLPAELLEAMDRLEQLLSTAAPPGLSEAARIAACPPDGLRALELGGRIVRLEADLAYATSAYQRLADQALAMARRGPLTPAAFRDATATSRRYVLAILEDLDRRGLLRRTPDGHLPGTKAPVA